MYNEARIAEKTKLQSASYGEKTVESFALICSD